MVAPTPEFTPVQSYFLPGTDQRLYVALNILNVDMQSRTFHAVITAYTLDKATQTLFDVQEHQGRLQASPAPIQDLADRLLDGASQNGVAATVQSVLDAGMNNDRDPNDDRPGNGLLNVDAPAGLTTEQLEEAAAKLKHVMEEFTQGIKDFAHDPKAGLATGNSVGDTGLHVDTPKT